MVILDFRKNRSWVIWLNLRNIKNKLWGRCLRQKLTLSKSKRFQNVILIFLFLGGFTTYDKKNDQQIKSSSKLISKAFSLKKMEWNRKMYHFTILIYIKCQPFSILKTSIEKSSLNKIRREFLELNSKLSSLQSSDFDWVEFTFAVIKLYHFESLICSGK